MSSMTLISPSKACSNSSTTLSDNYGWRNRSFITIERRWPAWYVSWNLCPRSTDSLQTLRRVATRDFGRPSESSCGSSWSVADGKKRGEKALLVYAPREHHGRRHITRAGSRSGSCEPSGTNCLTACRTHRCAVAAKNSMSLPRRRHHAGFAQLECKQRR